MPQPTLTPIECPVTQRVWQPIWGAIDGINAHASAITDKVEERTFGVRVKSWERIGRLLATLEPALAAAKVAQTRKEKYLQRGRALGNFAIRLPLFLFNVGVNTSMRLVDLTVGMVTSVPAFLLLLVAKVATFPLALGVSLPYKIYQHAKERITGQPWGERGCPEAHQLVPHHFLLAPNAARRAGLAPVYTAPPAQPRLRSAPAAPVPRPVVESIHSTGRAGLD